MSKIFFKKKETIRVNLRKKKVEAQFKANSLSSLWRSLIYKPIHSGRRHRDPLKEKPQVRVRAPNSC